MQKYCYDIWNSAIGIFLDISSYVKPDISMFIYKNSYDTK